MQLPPAATEFYAQQQRVNVTAANEVTRLWRRMSAEDLDASWVRIAGPVLSILVEAQTQVATAALAYLPNVLEQVDLPDRPRGDVNTSALVGLASDGRPLETLAYGAVVKTGQALNEGQDGAHALRAGGDFIDLMTKLQIADTARQVVNIGTIARTDLGGTVRVLIPPSCQRCTVLAGRVYRWSQGFQRHPRCDCVNMPVRSSDWAAAEGFVTDPLQAFRNGDIRDLSAAQRAAIEAGADVSQVVNAYRGMSTTNTLTGEGTTSRGRAGKKLGEFARVPGVRYRVSQVPRLTPEGIADAAAGDRTAAIQLLRDNGYLN